MEAKVPLPAQRLLWRQFGNRHDPWNADDDATQSIFIHVPRTAGTSVTRALNRKRLRHYPISRYAAFDRDRFRRYFKFAFVRNPWDRMLSAYAHLRRDPDDPARFPDTIWGQKHVTPHRDFEAFVLALRQPSVRRTVMSYIHFRPQLTWLTLPGSTRVEMDFVGRFERLPDDFAIVAERLGAEADLPRFNASSRGSYKDAYTDEMHNIVGELYAADIAAFDYRF